MRILLLNYNNGSRIPVLPQNLYVLKEAVERAGHECDVMDFNLHKVDYTDYIHGFSYLYDVIGLGFISGYWPHNEALKIAEAVRTDEYRHGYSIYCGSQGHTRNQT